ncbi:BLOC-2 complex member HPS3 isoform 2-T2 [Synchiropus picturatus]
MVHVYNCHPFASQNIVQVDQEPSLICCGGGVLFVVAAGGCKVEVFSLLQDGCPLVCRFSTMGAVRTLRHSAVGDYLVTIEEKNGATYLRAYTNWRCQAEEKSRVGVRLLGHLLRGASPRAGAQMEIIEIPLSERPVALSCCPITGDLLVGCISSLVLFTLRRPNQNNPQHLRNPAPQNLQCPGSNSWFLDFERTVILHFKETKPTQVALCSGYVAVQSELEVLVLKLASSIGPVRSEEPAETHGQGEEDFLLIHRHQELLGDAAEECGVSISVESTSLEEREQHTLSYLLYRRFSPDFFQGCSVEETKLHSLQLHPLVTSQSSGQPVCIFCFFSLPNSGFLYSLGSGVQLISTYQYPEKVIEVVLTDHLLHVITRNALQCFTVRCSAIAARLQDPYIDTMLRACPPPSLDVCALRMQMFIGLRSVSVFGRHVVLLSTADAPAAEEPERTTPRRGLRKWTLSSPKETSSPGPGWNLYVVDMVAPVALYREMVDYSQRYSEWNPQAQSLRHLLSEAHLLLRSSLLSADEETDKDELEEALKENCAQLGDSFSRGGERLCHLALPYYRMSGLSITEVIERNRPLPNSLQSFGPGFLFYLKHQLLEVPHQSLSPESADEVVDIFSEAEPSELVRVCSSPCMIRVNAARTHEILQRLECAKGVQVPLTVTMAAMMLQLGDITRFTQLMERHGEMQLVYCFIEEPRMLLHSGEHSHLRPTALTEQLAASRPGLLVAALVGLLENNKVTLEQLDQLFQVLGCCDTLLVDFWEAELVASSQDTIIQELLFRLASVYIDRLTHPETSRTHKSLRSVDDLINSCVHFGTRHPWLAVVSPPSVTHDDQLEALHKLQSLLCGLSLPLPLVCPLLDGLSDESLWGLSLHLLGAASRGQHELCIEKLLQRCPQALIAYADHHLTAAHTALWWQKLLPELCGRLRSVCDNDILLAALQETLAVVATEKSPAEFLELIPDDGDAAYFLPHLLSCNLRHQLT